MRTPTQICISSSVGDRGPQQAELRVLCCRAAGCVHTMGHSLPHAGVVPCVPQLTFPALQARQVQEQLSAQASDVATKMAGQAADIRGLNALVEQVGHSAVVEMACVRDELGRNGARPAPGKGVLASMSGLQPVVGLLPMPCWCFTLLT